MGCDACGLFVRIHIASLVFGSSTSPNIDCLRLSDHEQRGDAASIFDICLGVRFRPSVSRPAERDLWVRWLHSFTFRLIHTDSPGDWSRRVPVLQLSNLFFLVWNTACGFSKTKEQMIVFRFLSGLGGSAPLAVSSPYQTWTTFT